MRRDASSETAPFDFDVVVAALRDVLEAHGDTFPVIAPDRRLDALGLDSLDVAEFFVRLEQRTGAVVDPTSIDTLEIVGDLRRLRPLCE
jgi:acyl carrier protein